MCRVFFLLNNEDKTDELIHFFIQSLNLHNAPHLTHQPSFQSNMSLDGFGLVWKPQINHPKWQVLKSTQPPIELIMSDVQVSNKIEKIVNSPIILGHLRNKIIGDVSHKNTQPFIYDNHVFMHNGFVPEFNKLILQVSNKMKKMMHGETDSEVLFYLLLTIMHNIYGNKKLSSDDLVHLFHVYLKEVETWCNKGYINIIYSYGYYTVAVRTSIGYKSSLPFYVCVKNSGILISSEPMLETCELIGNKEMVVIGNNTTEIRRFPL